MNNPTMKKKILAVSAAWLIVAVVGVAFAAPALSEGDHAYIEPGHAECPVCKYHRDLECIDVEVDQKTPREVYQGRTYYFCSEECHREFVQDPDKFADSGPGVSAVKPK